MRNEPDEGAAQTSAERPPAAEQNTDRPPPERTDANAEWWRNDAPGPREVQ